jgi:GT2 family glycosyltransferase
LGKPASVSVVIPCFNYARYLPDAVESVLTQQGVDVDVIVVDDASTDESLAVARRLAERDPRVRVLGNPANSGPVDTFNRGLAEAKGEFLVRLDADDLLTPGSLSRAVAVMQALPGVGMVYGRPLHFTEGKLPEPRTRPTGWWVWSGWEWLAARCADGTNVITSPEVVMRRSVVDVVGGQKPLAHTHDMEMWLRISAHSDVAYVRGADQAWHRDHPASLSTKAEDPLVILREIRDAFAVLFDGLGEDYPDAEGLRRRSRQGVAAQALAQARRFLDRGQVSERARELVAFAAECAPDDPAVRRAEAVVRRGPGGGSAVGRAAVRVVGLAARGGRRLRDVVRTRRWQRNGVFEPLRLVGA